MGVPPKRHLVRPPYLRTLCGTAGTTKTGVLVTVLPGSVTCARCRALLPSSSPLTEGTSPA